MLLIINICFNPDSNSLWSGFCKMSNLCFIFSLFFSISLSFPLSNSPGTWASLVPFQVSNRTPILPTNVPNYGLNIIGEPFLQAETSNWGKKIKEKLEKGKKRKMGWEKKLKKEDKNRPAIAVLTITNSLMVKTEMTYKGSMIFH